MSKMTEEEIQKIIEMLKGASLIKDAVLVTPEMSDEEVQLMVEKLKSDKKDH